MRKKDKDEKFASHLPNILRYHQTMLADGVRNNALYEAIKQNVTPDTSFLDIGAGTGVWAILAAKLGAKRVVAVEIEECLIPFIFKHAQENGVANKIEIIHADSNDVKIRGRFDVVVSELFGSDAIGSATVKSFVDIRNRFLAPGGVLIPQKLAMVAAPVHYDRSINDLPADLPLTTEFLRSIKFNYGQPMALNDRRDIEFLAEPQKLLEIDFRIADDSPSLQDLSMTWRLKQMKRANAILTYNHSTFTDEIGMDSFGSQSWGAVLHEFKPFDTRSGDLKFRVTYDTKGGNWSLSLPSNPELKPQNYGPVFGFTRVRMAQQMTPHRKVRPSKQSNKKA